MTKKRGFVIDNTRYKEVGDVTEASVRTKLDVKGNQQIIIGLLDQGEHVYGAKAGELVLSNVDHVHRSPDSTNIDVAFQKTVTCYVEEDAKGFPGVVCGDFEAIRKAKQTRPLVSLFPTQKT